MVSHGRVELLAHPLSQKYLQMKWNSYGKYFHLANVLLYSIFLAFVTCFSSQLMKTENLDDDLSVLDVDGPPETTLSQILLNKTLNPDHNVSTTITPLLSFTNKFLGQRQNLKRKNHAFNVHKRRFDFNLHRVEFRA